MVSAERVMAYGRLEPEPPLGTHPDSNRPSSDWPNKGHIELSNVTYRHSPEGPQVLKGISATILPSEEVSRTLDVVQTDTVWLCSDWNSGSHWSRQVISDSNLVQTGRTRRQHQD